MGNTTTLEIGKRQFDLSNPDKALFPTEWDDEPVTKADLVGYYHKAADVMLPHLGERALVMVRYPDGIAGEGFFQKQAPDYFPNWIRRAELPKRDGQVTHVVCDDTATLAYVASQACITPHTWLSRVDLPDQPDRIIFDLDPSRPGFDAVRAAALGLRRLLEDVDLVPFVQTTGSRGLHVVVPMERGPDFDTVRNFARTVAQQLAGEHPELFTVEQRKAKRGDRVYLDIMRNAYGQSAVAPYAVRSLPGAPVATPLDWAEVTNNKLGPQKYNIHNLFRRLGQRNDPWAEIEDQARALASAQQIK